MSIKGRVLTTWGKIKENLRCKQRFSVLFCILPGLLRKKNNMLILLKVHNTVGFLHQQSDLIYKGTKQLLKLSKMQTNFLFIKMIFTVLKAN